VCGTIPCTLSSSSSTSTSTNTNTSSGIPTTQGCQARLKVTKLLASSREVIKVHRDLYVTFKDAPFLEYEILVENDSNCPATGVEVSDPLPRDFDCDGGVWHLAAQNPAPNHFKCEGRGREVRVEVGALRAGQTVIVEVRGKFPAEHTTSNVGHATAANAPGAHSDHVHVDVVSKKQFEADKGKRNAT
jgi:Domain of unknown function DUF11